ncbi:MAG: hypothetical protein VKO00_11435 [Cyanobacteriota bacterium]|nr:hypothetical protein [Cyanobacteriota bacterium]
MTPSTAVLPRAADHYHPPDLLQDLRLLDLLELSGSTLEAGRASGYSQPTVSRRTRVLTQDFALSVNRDRRVGCCYGTSPALHLLRLGCRAHRLAAGVARLGADVLLQPLLADCPWLLPAPPRFRLVVSWLELVRQGVLDGALVSGLEFAGHTTPPAHDLELLPLGEQPLGLAIAPGQVITAGNLPPVLVPNRTVAQGLRQQLQQRGLAIHKAGSACHTPAQWRQRLQRGAVAMPLPELEPAHWWQGLQRLPLPTPLSLPLWLVLPAGWRQQGALAHTAERLGYRHVAA